MNEKKNKKGSAGCDREFSPWHDEDGEFTSPEEKPKGSWSCQEKGQSSRRGRSRRFTSQVQRGQEEEPVLMHLPTLRAVFKRELENRNGELVEMNCGKCVEQYLRSLNAAIKASKGEMGKK